MASIGVAEPAAIVLTGGMSTRMGADKASLVVDGESMLRRVLSVLHAAGITSIAVAGSPELPDPEPRHDDAAGEGPMAGIVSGWRHLRSATETPADPVVVLSCDLPALTSNVVLGLLDRAAAHEHGALAHDGERPQPLIAAYRPVALDLFETAFEQGQRSVRKCFAGWDVAHVAFDANHLADADTPADLKGFEVQWPN